MSFDEQSQNTASCQSPFILRKDTENDENSEYQRNKSRHVRMSQMLKMPINIKLHTLRWHLIYYSKTKLSMNQSIEQNI